MKANIKYRVIELLSLLQKVPTDQVKVRPFCLEHGINYISLFNAFKADALGIGLVDSFKNAVPALNMNWFLYGEGDVLITNCLPIKNSITENQHVT